MSLEGATYIGDLVATNPDGATDPKSQGDDHLRMIKSVLQATFPGMAGRFHRVQSKSGNYTSVANDNQTLLLFTAAATLSCLAVATAGSGHGLDIYASGGDVTIDPNASELVNGQTTFVVPRGSAGSLFCDGSAYYFFGWAKGTGWMPGDIKCTAKAAADDGWLLCFGQAVSRTTYADLFAAIGTTYGAGDGSTTFNLPDLRGRVPAGKDNMGGVAAARLSSQVTGTTLGASGGAETHQLTAAQLASHTHGVSGNTGGQSADHTHSPAGATHFVMGNQGGGVVIQTAPGTPWSAIGGTTVTTGTSADHSHAFNVTSAAAGSDTAHNNVQPTIVLNYAIKY